MDIYEVLGYAGAFFTGLVLGLLGGGGAMLSIPVLVYLFRLDAAVATGYSLFLVGIAALSGTAQNIRKQLIDYKAALYYGVPSVVAVYVVRRFVIHSLPDVLFSIGSYEVDRNHFILFLFSIVMFGAAYKMITDSNGEEKPLEDYSTNYFSLALYAAGTGAFLGFVGAGGGFLIAPALVYFANLTMKKAIGTSLLLVAVNSFIGFAGDLSSNPYLDGRFLFLFSVFSVSGVFVGNYFSGFVNNRQLKKTFGWFILAAGVYIVVKETFLR
ncbi:MAG: sulfite exporter TauE/SafE family protein [Chitinophagales bacterium]|nr:sulfite exporter TauE/SafE family protein [Chitinophagales bacterium]